MNSRCTYQISLLPKSLINLILQTFWQAGRYNDENIVDVLCISELTSTYHYHMYQDTYLCTLSPLISITYYYLLTCMNFLAFLCGMVMDYIHTSGRNPFHLNNEGDRNLGGHGPDHLLSLLCNHLKVKKWLQE